MPSLAPDLDAELLAEFEADARRSFAALLASLSRAAHPAPVTDTPLPQSLLDPLVAATRLRDCWIEGEMLALPKGSMSARLPVPPPESIGLLDNLLALAAYSGTDAERVEAAGVLLHRLSEAAHPPEGLVGREDYHQE